MIVSPHENSRQINAQARQERAAKFPLVDEGDTTKVLASLNTRGGEAKSGLMFL
jgi:hypothetical protein